MTITGRKKDIIITAGGKNIAPANVENALRQSRWISHAVLFGDRKPYLVALITLDPDEIVPWADAPGIAVRRRITGGSPGRARSRSGSCRRSELAFRQRFTGEEVRAAHRDLSQEEGELTPTLKVKRNVVHRLHSGLYEGLYE